MVELAIALGIAINLLLAELIGFSAAGLVVPGYLALHLNQPARLAATLAVALATWATVRFGLQRVMVLYGRRRLGVTVIAGFLINAAFEQGLLNLPPQPLDLRVIGYIVPGLIASEALNQGFLPTAATTLLVAALVRIVLLLVFGWAG
ncbi:MAG: poly-gamma-glutamate biosynthesis protein PgsC [Acidobacteriota bacterium]